MDEKIFGKEPKNKRMITIIAVCAGIIVIALLLVGGYFYLDKIERAKKAEAKRTEKLEEDPLASLVVENPGEKVKLPNLKSSRFETDEITTGIDVSEFQGTINWEAVAASGIDFAMVRVGYRGMKNGVIVEDACAKYNLQEAEKNGLKLGVYFFSTAVTKREAKEEAEWVSKFISGYPVTYPVAYNCEGFQNDFSRQFGLSAAERTNLADVFLETIEKKDYVGMFYASKSELEDNYFWDTEALSLKYRIWIAQYAETAWPDKKEPDYSKDYAMWQYTNKGKIKGIKTPVDFNTARFGYSQSGQAADPGSAEHVGANVEAGVKFSKIEEQVTAREEVNLRSSMEQGADDNVVCSLKNGEVAVRTGIGMNGWSRVEYNGQTLYCITSYLTNDLSYVTPEQPEGSEFKTQFTAVSDNVTAKELTNLRNRPSVEPPSEVLAELKHGDVIARTGVSNEGWSRVDYNGQTLYCVSSYLEVVP